MSGTLRLSKIKFRAGAGPDRPPLETAPGTVFIFVGPNNSGKSLALREIENWCFGLDTARKVVDSLEVDFPDDPLVAENLARQFESSPPQSRGLTPGTFWMGQHTFRQDQPFRYFEIRVDQLKQATVQKDQNILRAWLSAFYAVHLDGRTRFLLADPKPTGDLQLAPQNHLWALFKNDAGRERVRKLTEDAFGLHFVIDPTGMQVFKIRMSSRAPATKNEEQALDESARRFHAQAQLISELSDGVQAFVGLVSALLSLPHKIILIDEPDAFLHPPLARRLGKNLAMIARERGASLVVATHSSEFLVGCIEVVPDTTIVRLTYDIGVATARVLSPAEIAEMTRDPLLRSTGVLSALFHKGAVVTESDSDRAFYDEMNRRLQFENRGIRDALFLNAQNRQTIHRLVRPLRRIGIAAAAIVDLDVLEENKTNWEGLLDACHVPATLKPNLEVERAYLSSVFSAVATPIQDARPIKSKGINALTREDKARAEALLPQLSKYGLFLVPGGELESWLSHLGVKDHGSDWFVNVFSKIGKSETDADYLRPGNDDIWKFIDEIAAWVNDSKRLGTD